MSYETCTTCTSRTTRPYSWPSGPTPSSRNGASSQPDGQTALVRHVPRGLGLSCGSVPRPPAARQAPRLRSPRCARVARVVSVISRERLDELAAEPASSSAGASWHPGCGGPHPSLALRPAHPATARQRSSVSAPTAPRSARLAPAPRSGGGTVRRLHRGPRHGRETPADRRRCRHHGRCARSSRRCRARSPSCTGQARGGSALRGELDAIAKARGSRSYALDTPKSPHRTATARAPDAARSRPGRT